MADVQLEMKAWAQQQHEQQHEQQQPRVQRKTLLQQAKDKLVRSLPVFNSIDINDLKARGLALWIAAVHLALYLTVGLYFISTVTSREYGRKFLSLTADPGSMCSQIPIISSGTYLADSSGKWETNSAFNGKPLYQLTLTGTKVTEEQYTKVMQNFATQLRVLGDRTASLDIIGSQIAWALFRASDADAMMTLTTTAQLGQIFAYVDTSDSFPVFSSAESVCRNPLLASAHPTFNPDTLALTVTVSANAPKTSAEPSPMPRTPEKSPAPSTASSRQAPTDEFCPDQISVDNEIFSLKDSPTHSFDIDLASTVTAFALNFGIIDTTSLTKLNSESWDFGGDVGIVLKERWIDDRYSQMRSVRCFSKPGAPRVCVGMYGYTYVYPVLYTSDYKTWTACQCPRDARVYNCNLVNDFQLALVFPSKDNSDAPTIRAGWALQRMMQEGPDGPSSVINLVSGLALSASVLSRSSQYDAWRRAEAVDGFMPYSQFIADFQTLGPGASLLSLALYYNGEIESLNVQDVTLDSLATSHFYGSHGMRDNVTFGYVMCTDTIFQPQALQQMTLAPPMPVVQPYLSCHSTLSSAFVTAAGLAAANSALVSSIFLVLAVFLTVQYFNNFSSDSSKKIVAPADKALRAAETEKRLLANDERLQSEVNALTSSNDKLLAKYEAVSSELAAIKALLTRQQVQELSQQWQNTADTQARLSIGAANALFGGENPLHRRGKHSGLPAARLSLTGVAPAPAPAPAEEQTNR